MKIHKSHKRCMNFNGHMNLLDSRNFEDIHKYLKSHESLKIRLEIRITHNWKFIWMNLNERFMKPNTNSQSYVWGHGLFGAWTHDGHVVKSYELTTDHQTGPQSVSPQIINILAEITNYTKISDILDGNHEIRLTRQFEIRGILWSFSVPINCASRGPPVFAMFCLRKPLANGL